jgi:hypothetical protein
LITGRGRHHRHAWVNDFTAVTFLTRPHDRPSSTIVGYIPDVIHAVHGRRRYRVACFGEGDARTRSVVIMFGGHHDKISSVSIHGPKGTAELRDALTTPSCFERPMVPVDSD